jgi:hypothetical protein
MTWPRYLPMAPTRPAFRKFVSLVVISPWTSMRLATETRAAGLSDTEYWPSGSR